MSETREKAERDSLSEETSSLWLITFAASIWAVHFVLAYAAAAVVCAKSGGDPEAVLMLRLGIGVLTVLALAGIGFVGWRSWLQWDFLDDYRHVHDLAEEEDRHEFLGHASFLLSIISFIGVIYVTLPVVFIGTCR